MNTKIVTVAEMRRLEAAADAAGVSYAAMMERAGKAVAEAILARVTPSAATAQLCSRPALVALKMLVPIGVEPGALVSNPVVPAPLPNCPK
ncbi:MAG: hypothetical protein HYZ35_04785, partial [Chloroflexi bacterium]|nr:hypothetical protein [Chloroflexota bacterium]